MEKNNRTMKKLFLVLFLFLFFLGCDGQVSNNTNKEAEGNIVNKENNDNIKKAREEIKIEEKENFPEDKYKDKPYYALLKQLRSKNIEIRFDAREKLGKIKDKMLVSCLIKMLYDKDIMGEAAYVLGDINDKDAIPELIKVMQQAKNEEDCTWVMGILALKFNNDKSSKNAILRVLKNNNFEIRMAACYHLQQFKYTDVVLPLINALKDNPKGVRRGAWDSLKQITGEDYGENYDEWYSWWEKNKDKLLDKEEFFYKGKFLNEWLELLKNKDPNLRAEAITILVYFKEKVPVNIFTNALEDENSKVRSSAAKSLGLIQEQSTVPMLIKTLKDKDIKVRKKAAESLGKIGDRSAIPALIEAIKNEPTVSQEAFEAMSKLGDDSIPEAIKFLQDERKEIKLNAILVLGYMNAKSAIPALVNLLKENDSEIRLYIVSTLGRIDDQSTVMPLIKVFQEDTNHRVRVAAIAMIGGKKELSAVPVLIEALKDSDKEIVMSAARALGMIGSKKAIPSLIKVLDTDDVIVRDVIEHSLKDLTGEKNGENIDWRAWWNENKDKINQENKK